VQSPYTATIACYPALTISDVADSRFKNTSAAVRNIEFLVSNCLSATPLPTPYRREVVSHPKNAWANSNRSQIQYPPQVLAHPLPILVF
jgi:hypothetical protein